MKRLLIAATALFCITSCETKSDSASENSNKIAEQNAATTRKVYTAIETGDTKGLDSFFTADVIDHNAGDKGEDVKGIDSVKAKIAAIHNYFDGLKMEMLHHATSPDGEYHYITMRMTGTAKANPWGMPVGMKVDNTGVDVVKLKDGKCTEHWGYMSMQDVMEMQAPPPPVLQKKK